jgi:hypothetical protein
MIYGYTRASTDGQSADAQATRAPRRRSIEIEEEIDRRRLAGAIGAEQAEDFALGYEKIEIVERGRGVFGRPVIALGQADGSEHVWPP